MDELSGRELEILELIADGYSNQAIQQTLWISEKTLETHTRHIFLKLGLMQSAQRNRRVLAAIAFHDMSLAA